MSSKTDIFESLFVWGMLSVGLIFGLSALSQLDFWGFVVSIPVCFAMFCYLTIMS